MKAMRKYLFWFINEHLEFRKYEIESILSTFNISINCITEKLSSHPYWIVELDSDEIALRIASRSVTLKTITEIWAYDTAIENVHLQLKKYASNVLKNKYADNPVSFKIDVEVFGTSQTLTEKLRKIESFNYLPIKGQVKLDNPELTLQCVEYYGTKPNDVPKEPYEIFFGRLVAKGHRKAIAELSLKNRKFIGNTSMDAEMSLLMANQAKLQDGHLVFDPFVGTGSLLVAAAYYGGYVMGMDIDFQMLHGRTKPTRIQNRNVPRRNESVLANLKQYKLEGRYIDVLVGDSSVPVWKDDVVFDAIITDPPYGIRESSEKIGKKIRVKDKPRRPNSSDVHYPTKVTYHFHQVMRDLLCFSAKHLKMGGRLVTWIPVFRKDYTENTYLPTHNCFDLVANSEQILSNVISRRLLTFEKVRECQFAESDEICRSFDNAFKMIFHNYRQSRAEIIDIEKAVDVR